MSSNEQRFGGYGDHQTEPIHSREEPFDNLPFSAVIDLPPMSAVYYTFKKSPKRRSKK